MPRSIANPETVTPVQTIVGTETIFTATIDGKTITGGAATRPKAKRRFKEAVNEYAATKGQNANHFHFNYAE